MNRLYRKICEEETNCLVISFDAFFALLEKAPPPFNPAIFSRYEIEYKRTEYEFGLELRNTEKYMLENFGLNISILWNPIQCSEVNGVEIIIRKVGVEK